MRKKLLCWGVIISQVCPSFVRATDVLIEEETIASRIIIPRSSSMTENIPKPRFIVAPNLNDVSS